MKRAEAATLVDKYLAGRCTPEECAIVEQAYNMTAEPGQTDIPPGDTELLKAYVFDRVMAAQVEGAQRIRIPRPWGYGIAAALLAMLTIGTYFFLGNTSHLGNTMHTAAVQLSAESVAPGKNRATLTFADGRAVDLSEVQSGIVIGDAGITYQDGSAVEINGDHGGAPIADYVTLSTPKGGTYQVILSDGSQVWLNAGSALKYPNGFSSTERRVELDGEAYFSIAKDVSRPFRIASRGQEVEVLGTEFNISAYQDDDISTTTLVNGAVNILNSGSNTVTRLSPGFQSIVRKSTGHTDIQAVQTQLYTSWKDGYFSLYGSIPDILERVSRWYDVDVRIKGTMNDSLAMITFPRDVPLSTVLTAIQMASPDLKYQLIKNETTNKGGAKAPERRLTIFK